MSHPSLETLSESDLLTATRTIIQQTNALTVELLLHLAELDERKLYLSHAYPSMFAFCVEELGLSADVAFNRIGIARLLRELPAVLDYVRSGQVHLTGLRVLAPHLTRENHVALLSEATGRSKRAIEEQMARLAPKPSVPDSVRLTPKPQGLVTPEPDLFAARPSSPPLLPPKRDVVQPLSEDTFKVQFTASRRVQEKLREAQALLSHRAAQADLATVIERALDLLLLETKKKKFGVGRTPRKATASANAEKTSPSRHVPDAIKREVYQRDDGQCTYVGKSNKRCGETRHLEFDHIEGFARTHSHSVEKIRLLCRAHNSLAAEQMYGAAFMEKKVKQSQTQVVVEVVELGGSLLSPNPQPLSAPTSTRPGATPPSRKAPSPDVRPILPKHPESRPPFKSGKIWT